jgi:cell division protein FtsI (penicillin-binding protein 3)/stage V sporulation protein D (sporulation-specific penicillin-binding protein)
MAPRAGGRRAGGRRAAKHASGRATVATDGRIRLLRILAVAAFLLVGGRAIALASTAGELTSMAAGQQQNTHTLPAHRGAIYDRDGKELAVGEQRQTVYATPYLIEDPFAVAGDLCRVLKIRKDADQQRIVAALSDKDSGFAFIARKVDPEKAKRAVDLGIPGVGSYPEEKRVYPLKGVAAQVIGYAGLDNVGLAGMEQQYESTLKGADGSETVVRDTAGRTIRVLETEKSVPGTSVRLTIDADIQYEAEQVLRRTVTGFSAKAGTAIVLDPRTGEVLAMANYPLIEDHLFGAAQEFERNRAVTDAYEPGSIFKAVTIAGALSDGLTTPSTKYRLAPTIKVADREIHEAHARGSVTYTTREILVHSSNVGAVTVGMDMGKEGLLKWVDEFGFGETTGIDFPGEVGGIVPREWSGSTIGNLPLGQGIAVTPMQMACAFGVLANKGMWVQPHLTAQIGTEDVPKAKRHRVVTAKVAHQMLSMLTDAVDEGTGTPARIAGYKVAGKTGTAQKPLPDGSGYSKYAYVASFVGVMPADHPKLVVLVSVDEPHPIWGGVVAAPAVKEIASFALTHLEIAP